MRPVFVREDTHRSLIWVRKSEYVDGNFTEEDPVLGWRRFRIEPYGSIELRSLATANVDPLPYPEIPKATDIATGFKPDPLILALQKHDGVAAYVRYSGTTSLVSSKYEHAVTFENDDNYHCRAREIVLATQSLSLTVTIQDVNQGLWMTVAPDATVGFTQLDKVYGAGDYKQYFKLAQNDVVIKAMKKKRICKKGRPILPYPAFKSATVECTSSQWP